MKKALAVVGTTTLVMVVLWLAALVTQPQPFDKWQEYEKLAYVHLYVPDLDWHMSASNTKYFCDTETHILMERGAFLGIHLPSTNLKGEVVYCEYWMDVYNPPWEQKKKFRI